MRSTARSLFAGLLLAAGALPVSALFAQDIKPGLWEMKQRPQFDGQRKAQMEQAQKQMAALPPEQRKQMESMMAQHGLKMDFAAGEVSLKACVTKDQAARALLPNRADGKCEHDTKRNGNQLLVTFRCTNPASEGTNEITLDGPDHYMTKSMVRTQRDGKTETMNATGDARWLGSDCGSIKPQTAQDAQSPQGPQGVKP